jgi:hypothetical protein
VPAVERLRGPVLWLPLQQVVLRAARAWLPVEWQRQKQPEVRQLRVDAR